MVCAWGVRSFITHRSAKCRKDASGQPHHLRDRRRDKSFWPQLPHHTHSIGASTAASRAGAFNTMLSLAVPIKQKQSRQQRLRRFLF